MHLLILGISGEMENQKLCKMGIELGKCDRKKKKRKKVNLELSLRELKSKGFNTQGQKTYPPLYPYLIKEWPLI